MLRRLAILVFCLAVSPLSLLAQSPPSPSPNTTDQAGSEKKGTYLGVLFGPIPEVRAKQLPGSLKNAGVVVTQVLPDSPAAQAGIQRDDIVLLYDQQIVRDSEHFMRLIQTDKPERKVRLALIRGSKAIYAEPMLVLGPKLRMAGDATVMDPADPRGVAKPGSPGYVTVAATPLTEGRMKLSVEFIPEGGDRSRVLTCEGKDDAIDRFVKELPAREQEAVRKAVERIRSLNTTPPANTPSGGPPTSPPTR